MKELFTIFAGSIIGIGCFTFGVTFGIRHSTPKDNTKTVVHDTLYIDRVVKIGIYIHC